MRSLIIFTTILLCRIAVFADPVVPTILTVATGRRHTVHAVYPVEKIKSDYIPSVMPVQKLSLVAAQNETEPFILLVNSQVPLRDVDVVPGAMIGEKGGRIPQSNIDIYRVGYVHIDEPSGTGMKTPLPYQTGTGAYPDPLVKGPGTVRARRNLQFWVSIRVPNGIPAGQYRGEIRLCFRREGWMPKDDTCEDRIPILFEVRSFALPPNALLNIGVAATSQLPEWLQREDIKQAIMRNFVDHAHVPDPLPSPIVSRDKQGKWIIDSEAWEKTAADLFDNHRLPFLMLPVFAPRRDGQMQGVYFLYHYPVVSRQRWFGEFICDSNKELTVGFKNAFGAYLKHMAAVVRKHGWEGKIFITTMDEPYTYHLHTPEDRKFDIPENNYKVIRNYVDFVRSVAPGFKIFITADPCDELNGYIDCWCLRNMVNVGKAQERARRYNELFIYCDNYRHFIDYPAISTRSMGWLAWRIGAKGWLTYETLGQFVTAWEEPVFSYPVPFGPIVWGMGQFFYPDIRNAGGVSGSIRWEMMREGCEDYAYLALLESQITRLSQEPVKDDEMVRDAIELLRKAPRVIAGFSGDLETVSDGGSPNEQCNSIAHRFRGQIGDLIEKLSRK